MKKGLNYLLVAFFVAAGLALAPVVSNAATLSFDPPVATVVPNSAFGMGVGASGDFNNDGNLDYVIARHRNFDPYTRVTLMLGNGDGTFSAGAEILTGSSDLYGLKVGDVNNDGNLDIVTVHNHARAVAVTLGNGDGTFATTVVMPVLPQGGRSVGLGDLNGDGYLDIIAGSSYNHTSVLLNNGDGTFGAPTNYGDPIFWGSTDIEVADLDGDGDNDVVSADVGSVDIYLNDGAGNLTKGQRISSDAWSLVLADFDGDGNIDLAHADVHEDVVKVYAGNGDGTFGAVVNHPVGDWPGSVKAADLDGDGVLDLATANYWSNSISVLLGDGAGSFAAATSLPDPLDLSVVRLPGNIDLGDYNGDGKPDVFNANYAYRTFSVMLNTTEFADPQVDLVVDIKPGSDKNPINLKSKGVTPVAVLSTEDFDANTLDTASLAFGPAGAAPKKCHAEDVNEDGLDDLVCHFPTQDTGIGEGDESAELSGETEDGTPAVGEDSVSIVPQKGKK
ncbi:MAG: VCBS repeat-containing protein [Nitrospinaceae bacterium]|jgi:hypothetical protein|nr:VCBS repeat-containing protein [Nitrospinaceae bacterium]MBT4094616.1 VCBS repeat-containing protein [Nitrospinaceae bacterium]MBT4430577.1 VCBS repeat-containing protein [Nitrospinaceae bacterium]MBT5368720.1 VCBS repeat-containing protein [Nitrospinaceae bacterium]MBT7855687.1 VCBS repeat-containing protein [Nitrospinaceae bacterium]